MLLLVHIERVFAKSGKNEKNAPLAWTLEGRAVMIQGDDRNKVVQEWLPLFFPKGKFESFTRKLYRWGFRQVSLSRPSSEAEQNRTLVFASPCFQKDRRSLMAYMKSVTARNNRRVIPQIRKRAPEGDVNQDDTRGSRIYTNVVAPPRYASHLAGIPTTGTAIQMDPSRVVIIPQGMPLAGALGQFSSGYPSGTKITIMPAGNPGVAQFFPCMMGAQQYPPSYPPPPRSGSMHEQHGTPHHHQPSPRQQPVISYFSPSIPAAPESSPPYEGDDYPDPRYDYPDPRYHHYHHHYRHDNH